MKNGTAKENLTARDVMNKEIMTVPEGMTIQELASFLTEREISGAPVVDEQGKMVGVVSLTDIAQSTMENPDLESERSNPDFYVRGWEDDVDWREVQRLHVENSGLSVSDIMTPTVYTVPEDTRIRDIAKTMIAGRIHRLLVTRDDRVVGIVTTLDMLKILAR